MDSPIQTPHQAFYIRSMLFNSGSATRAIAVLDSIFSSAREHAGNEWPSQVATQRLSGR
jgi:hypothetical protein